MQQCHFGTVLSQRLLDEGGEFAARCDDFFRWVLSQSSPRAEEVESQLRRALPGARVSMAPASGSRVFDVVGGDRRSMLKRDALLSRSPRESPVALRVSAGWSLGQALEQVVEQFGVDLSNARVRVGFGRGHLLHLTYFTELSASRSDPRLRYAVERFSTLLLGEDLFFDWVGQLDVAPAPRRSSLSVVNNAKPNTLGLEELVPAVRAGIQGLRRGLSDRPHVQRSGELKWTLFESEPNADAADAAQNDLILASSATPELLRTFLLGEPIASCRFTRADEIFCYLKWDDTQLLTGQRLARRDAMESAINQALGSDQLGIVVGTGLGVRHSYLNLALSDGELALERLLTAARGAHLGTNVWLMFFDTAWDEHWLTLDGA